MAEETATKKTTRKTTKKNNSALLEALESLRHQPQDFEYKNTQIRYGYTEANKMLDDCICLVKGEFDGNN